MDIPKKIYTKFQSFSTAEGGGVVAEESQDQNEAYFGVGQIQTVSWIARDKRKG